MKSIFFRVFFLVLSVSRTSAQTTIKINLREHGRTFEGIGALSAGASSRLLIDYPEPARGQILDFLFKPNYAASLQHFKVEIGGDVNSTCGTEPSHARTREEFLNPKPEFYKRGYEWWLMEEAKKRNPDIYLDCLEWGAPGWIGDGKFYSKDNIKYIISFIKGAKKYHNLNINFTGIWNERMYDIEFIKNLRKELNQSGLNYIAIVAADQCCDNQKWLIAEDMKKDEALRNAVAVLGDHYPERDKGDKAYNSSINAKNLGIPIWDNEGGPWKGDWEGFQYLGKMFNRNYIEGRMTKNIIWSLITSYFDNLSLPNSGLMTANTPWSGYFKVEPAIWAVAHTTQFAKPGWRYVDSGCGYFMAKGSYVTLISDSSSANLSIIAETIDADTSQTVTFLLRDSEQIKKIYVWRSVVGGKLFERLAPIAIKNNQFSITFLPRAIYSLTTTTGQHKGTLEPADARSFPFPYKDDFESSALGLSPKYFSDQGGAFEVSKRKDNKGNCLKQVITSKGIEWESEVFNQTVLGDTTWTNYCVSSDVFFLEAYSYATVLARVTETHRSHKLPEGYSLKLQSSGQWSLMAGSHTLVRGTVPKRSGWHKIALEAKGDTIKAMIDGYEIANIHDSTYNHGVAGLGSSFHHVEFDNFSIADSFIK